MKQLPMSPELQALITSAVGPDVDAADLTVFEAVAINSKPLPGKSGSLFENAVIMPITLKQMADHLLQGNHLPLIVDHDLSGAPKGRVIHGELLYADDGALELRVLFYLDATEETLIAKLNASSLDEVSVSFLATEFKCSECGWDYFGDEAQLSNFVDRQCINGHTIGSDGVHAQLVGLSQFIEVSLVARGAADKPKIVGRSQSRLLPDSSLRLAAKGFEIDGLICQASMGEDLVTIDTNKLMTDLVDAKTATATLTIEKTNLMASLAAAEARAVEAEAKAEALATELSAADPDKEGHDLAIVFLTEVLTNVLVASGKDIPAELPKTVAQLKAEIEDNTSKLTAILPVGGVSKTSADNSKPALVVTAYSNRNLGK